MHILIGIVIVIFSLIAWVGQMISAISPKVGASLGVIEPESEVDETFFIDQRAEAVWDSFVLWPLVIAGILLLLNIKSWSYFGIIGGSVFTYFSGRGIVTRLFLKKNGIAIGNPGNLKTNLIFLLIWMMIGVGTIIYSMNTLIVR